MFERKAFWTIYLSVGVSYLGVGLVAPLIAVVLANRGENSLMVGLVGTATFAAFTVASFPLGALIDRTGPKSVLVSGLMVYGTAILAFAFIEATWLFFIARIFEGIGAAAISVSTETMINWLSTPADRARRMSYYALAVGLGWAAGPISGTLLFGITPAVPFVVGSALSALAAVLGATLIQKTGSAPHHIERLLSVFSVHLLAPISAGAIYGYCMSSLVTLFPLYLTKELEVPETAMGAIITAVIVGTIVSQIPIGRAADRFGKRRVLCVSSVGLAALFWVMALQTDWRAFIPAGALVGALAGSLYPIGLSIIGGLVTKERLGAATSLFSLAFGVGSLIGPSASGLMMTTTGNARWLFYLPALITAGFALELLTLYRVSAPHRGLEPAD